MSIKKVDYYCGAFLSYLIFNGIEPTLFEAGEKSRIIRFGVKKNDYKVLIKYTTAAKESTKASKVSTKWDTIFTQRELEILSTFQESRRISLIVLICTDVDMKNTFFPVLTYDDAIACLGMDTVNKQKRISISHLKGSPYISCYGTALSDIKALQKDYNCDKFFGFEEVTHDNP